jgi:hypothetical protein
MTTLKRMPPARRPAAPSMTEAHLLTAVLDLCKLLHLRVAHFRPARTDRGWRTAVQGDGAGWPDLVIVGPGGVIYRELKTDRGRISPVQADWLVALVDAGQDAGTWRPEDLASRRIERELLALRRPR